MITTTPVTAYGFANFNDALFQLIKQFERDIPFVYADGKGIPTLKRVKGVSIAILSEPSCHVAHALN